MRFSSSGAKGRRSRGSGVFPTYLRRNSLKEEECEQQGGKVRWAVLSWFYKFIGANKTKVKKSCKVDTRFFDTPRLYSEKCSEDCKRDSLASLSKSMSIDLHVSSGARHPRRSAIDLTTCRRNSGIKAVSCLKSVDSILSSYSFFVTCHKGSHAKIIKGRSKHTGERVILKVYDKEKVPPSQLENISKEIKILTMAKGLDFVVQLHGSYQDSQQGIVVLEDCSGGTLISHIVSNGGRLSEAYCIRLVVRPLLMTLDWFHKKGIVIRDLKPEHIMFDCSGRLRLLDFFSAALPGEDDCISREGSLSYMAPEVVKQPKIEDSFHDILNCGLSDEQLDSYSEKVDIWSLGVIVFEALTGRQPFLAETCNDMMAIQDKLLGVDEGIRTSLDSIKMKEFMSEGAIDFLGKVLCLDPLKRPSCADLMQHPWVQMAPSPSTENLCNLESNPSKSEDIQYDSNF